MGNNLFFLSKIILDMSTLVFWHHHILVSLSEGFSIVDKVSGFVLRHTYCGSTRGRKQVVKLGRSTIMPNVSVTLKPDDNLTVTSKNGWLSCDCVEIFHIQRMSANSCCDQMFGTQPLITQPAITLRQIVEGWQKITTSFINANRLLTRWSPSDWVCTNEHNSSGTTQLVSNWVFSGYTSI